jgi:hypothetical protein
LAIALAPTPESWQARRRLADADERMAEARQKLKDGTGALAAYQAVLAVRKGLAAGTSCPEAERDLADTYDHYK